MIRRIKTFFLLLFTLFVVTTQAAESRKNVIVSDQSQFDALDATLKKHLRQGVTQLTINLQPGTYYYGNKHLDLSSLIYPNAKVSIVGHGALLVAKNLGRERDWQDGSFDVVGRRDVDRWSELVFGADTVEVIDAEAKLCRIRTLKRQPKRSAEQCKGHFLQLTEWYDSKVYPIVRYERRYIYFTATDLNYQSQYRCWNVNTDMLYGKVCPRYRTITPTASVPHVRYCQASTFARLYHSSLGGFTVKDVAFGPNNGSAPLIDTDTFSSLQLLLEGCTFTGVRGTVVKVWYTDNVMLRSCIFEGCYHNGIESYNGSRKTQVIGCTFRNHGRGLRQNFGVICRGEDFQVKGNTFVNFSYAGIGAGVWYGHESKAAITGLITDNALSFDPDYYDDYAQHTLMDGGAIYTWTKCDRVQILNNTINRYRGMKDYRGIFCDDGGKNITVRGNTVTNIGAEWCIDFRWTDHVAHLVPDHNTGNDVRDNKVDGKVKFETRKP